MTTLYLDLETYSEERIQHGVHRYAERARIMDEIMLGDADSALKKLEAFAAGKV